MSQDEGLQVGLTDADGAAEADGGDLAGLHQAVGQGTADAQTVGDVDGTQELDPEESGKFDGLHGFFLSSG